MAEDNHEVPVVTVVLGYKTSEAAEICAEEEGILPTTRNERRGSVAFPGTLIDGALDLVCGGCR